MAKWSDMTADAMAAYLKFELGLLGKLRRFPRAALVQDKQFACALVKVLGQRVPAVNARAFGSGERAEAMAFTTEGARGSKQMKRDVIPQLLLASRRGATPRRTRRTLLGARVRWMVGMVKAFVGEATDNPELEVEGTVAKLLGRAEVDNLSRRHAWGALSLQRDAGSCPEPYDINLHEQVARHLELAARHHRQALRAYRSGEHDQGCYHACVAQRFVSDAGEISTELGKGLWRGMVIGR